MTSAAPACLKIRSPAREKASLSCSSSLSLPDPDMLETCDQVIAVRPPGTPGVAELLSQQHTAHCVVILHQLPKGLFIDRRPVLQSTLHVEPVPVRPEVLPLILHRREWCAVSCGEEWFRTDLLLG